MSLKDKLEAADASIARAQKRKSRAAHKLSSQTQAARTRRLIQIGAILDHWIGSEASPENVSALMERVAIPSTGMLVGEWLASMYAHIADDR